MKNVPIRLRLSVGLISIKTRRIENSISENRVSIEEMSQYYQALQKEVSFIEKAFLTVK